jgi:hypothetical protein
MLSFPRLSGRARKIVDLVYGVRDNGRPYSRPGSTAILAVFRRHPASAQSPVRQTQRNRQAPGHLNHEWTRMESLSIKTFPVDNDESHLG